MDGLIKYLKKCKDRSMHNDIGYKLLYKCYHLIFIIHENAIFSVLVCSVGDARVIESKCLWQWEHPPPWAPAVLILAQQQYKHVAVEEAATTVMYLLSNLCLSERPYILFREWHFSSCNLWSGAGIWWGLEHAVLMDELVKVVSWCCAPHRTHRAGWTQSYGETSHEK